MFIVCADVASLSILSFAYGLVLVMDQSPSRSPIIHSGINVSSRDIHDPNGNGIPSGGTGQVAAGVDTDNAMGG